jgi:hypothetical protein
MGLLVGAAGGIGYTIGYCVGVSRETKRWIELVYPKEGITMPVLVSEDITTRIVCK